MATKLAEDRRRRVGGEGDTALGVEAVERLDEAEARDLDQVLERLAAAAVARSEPPDERHEAARELLADDGIAGAREPIEEVVLLRHLLRRPGNRAGGCCWIDCGQVEPLPPP